MSDATHDPADGKRSMPARTRQRQRMKVGLPSRPADIPAQRLTDDHRDRTARGIRFQLRIRDRLTYGLHGKTPRQCHNRPRPESVLVLNQLPLHDTASLSALSSVYPLLVGKTSGLNTCP